MKIVEPSLLAAAARHKEPSVVPRSFYLQPTEDVARGLLGKLIVARGPIGLRSGIIVETEAYGPSDPASHAFRGPTEGNAAMFGPPGHAYVYLSYGIHWMLNFVTQPEGVGEAVLIRALQPFVREWHVEGEESVPLHRLMSGPGKLARALGITRAEFDGKDLCRRSGKLVVLDTGVEFDSDRTAVSTRVGITHAADRPLRFFVSGHPSVSRK